MRGKPGVTVKDVAFQRGEAHEAARIARLYGKAGRLKVGVKKWRTSVRRSIRERTPLGDAARRNPHPKRRTRGRRKP